jgi:hypothetical protein
MWFGLGFASVGIRSFGLAFIVAWAEMDLELDEDLGILDPPQPP